ncbi:hypothetical protein [Rhodococcus opacus]|uniref:hypothetical protein n=1 Tax=Rhodococcus opacus TaxID=37919 RepID=UPI001C48315C|nr:hypothetical protein [Rhodococcus opacus]MBV6760214.1 hypothetical protein [Rhodococcus opacus]
MPMTMSAFSTTSAERVGAFVRRRRSCGHRTGQWAQILTTASAREQAHFLVIYDDGDTELLLVDAHDGHYEFGPSPTSWKPRLGIPTTS